MMGDPCGSTFLVTIAILTVMQKATIFFLYSIKKVSFG